MKWLCQKFSFEILVTLLLHQSEFALERLFRSRLLLKKFAAQYLAKLFIEFVHVFC